MIASFFRGLCCCTLFHLSTIVMKENDIKNIETIELKLKIYEADSLDTIDETGPLTFTVK